MDEFHFYQAYSRMQKSSDCNLALGDIETSLANRLHFEDSTACYIHSTSLMWVALESSLHALFKNALCEIKILVVMGGNCLASSSLCGLPLSLRALTVDTSAVIILRNGMEEFCQIISQNECGFNVCFHTH